MYQWERRLRLGTGLVLALYVVQHLLNHSLGIVGFEAMEAWRRALSPVWDQPVIMLLLHGSLWTHIVLALVRLYRRRTLRMPAWEWTQLAFGLSIAPLVAAHVIGTRVAAELGGFDPDYRYMATIIAGSPRQAVQLPLLVIVVWVHLVVGLHFWLRLFRWYRRTFPVWVVLGLLIPAGIALAITGTWTGALLGFLWGGLVRIMMVHHITWSVNSVGHLWRNRPYKSHDNSRNNPIFGVLAFGEGWNNNHHAFPTSARHGLRWWQFDMSYMVIRVMGWLGLAREIRVPSHARRHAKMKD